MFFKSMLWTGCMRIHLNSRTIISLSNLYALNLTFAIDAQANTNICSFITKSNKRFLHSKERHVTDSKHNIHPPRRALLYVPGHDIRKIEKIPKLDADLVVLDCEDGVALEKKEKARLAISTVYPKIEIEFNGQLGVRVNSPSSGLMVEDLRKILTLKKLPSTIVVPKINEHEELIMFCRLIEEKFDQTYHIPQKQCLNVIFMTETARGLINLKEIIEAGIAASSSHTSHTKISGVIFGSDDYCADIGITRSNSSTELLYARQKIVATAKAYNLNAIDMVYIDYKDDDGLRKQATEGANMGFNGKQIIHPNQIEIVQECFMPRSNKITWAKNLLEAYKQSKQGAFTFEGQMIDMPTILQAKNITEQYNIIKNKPKI